MPLNKENQTKPNLVCLRKVVPIGILDDTDNVRVCVSYLKSAQDLW